ncbi:hypothetical protein F5Y03DRAFT_396521 [Xylaria venustula]|nr:hypothetical protein F5Y03DRAFT_396521 [Xylaria venustula]
MFSQDTLNGVACIALASIDTIGKFLERTEHLQLRLGHKTGGLESSWSKVGWQLFGRVELHALKTQLHERLTSINTLITITSCSLNTPSSVAQYEDKIGWCHDDSKVTFSSQRTNLALELPDRAAGVLSMSHDNPLAIPRLSLSPIIQTQSRLSTETTPIEGVPIKEDKSMADLEQEVRAKIKAEIASATRGTDARAPEEQLKENIEIMKQMVMSLHEKEVKRETDAKTAAAKAKEIKAPIRFKDAVGRKFSFPFHICKTWQGMDELIKQAFAHVDVIGPHVQHGHYDLVGPSGEIILPQVWDTVIEPDWQIQMHMWPMERPDPRGHPSGQPPTLIPPPQDREARRNRYPSHTGSPAHPNLWNNGQGGQPNSQPVDMGHVTTNNRGKKGLDNFQIPDLPPSYYQDNAEPVLKSAQPAPDTPARFPILDSFDPHWQHNYSDLISSARLTDEFIKQNQRQTVSQLENLSDSVEADSCRATGFNTPADTISEHADSPLQNVNGLRVPQSRPFRKIASRRTRAKRRPRFTQKRGNSGTAWETDED